MQEMLPHKIPKYNHDLVPNQLIMIRGQSPLKEHFYAILIAGKLILTYKYIHQIFGTYATKRSSCIDYVI